ncbi:MAG: heavy-metal-associated domain-containing protein, partial [Gemmataceae bacterium]|nr:heavy-metal-associated domain-containing protein [Gemmataceae bacterium]
MPTRRYRTNLRCQACVASLAPLLDAEPGIASWRADVAVPDKTLTVEGEAPPQRVAELLERAGYKALGEAPEPSQPEAPAREGKNPSLPLRAAT